MTKTRPSLHLFVDISSHGFGHLAQAASVLNELGHLLPDLRLTLRCALPPEKIRTRLRVGFEHIAGHSDFGFVMHDAVSIDLTASAQAYRHQHGNWSQRVADEAGFLAALRPDLVLTDVAYLPLAGAASAGIRSLSMCSLNWADLFAHFFGRKSWAAPIYLEMLAAYGHAESFLRLTPAMPMDNLPRTRRVSPVAALGLDQRDALRQRIGCLADEKLVLIAFGGFDKDLALDRWALSPGIRWLIPQSWAIERNDMTSIESLGIAFIDLLASVDAVLTKPGYGTFTEAACNGTAVLYVRRNDWPEQECLIEWLQSNARCRELSEAELISGNLQAALDAVWRQVKPPAPPPEGAAEAAAFIAGLLTCRSSATRTSIPDDQAG